MILSRKPASWDDFFAALKGTEVPSGFPERDRAWSGIA